MSGRRRVALASLAAVAALAGITACRGPDYTPPASPPVVAPVNLPPDTATLYKFQADLGGVRHDCIAYDGGNNGGLFCAPVVGQ